MLRRTLTTLLAVTGTTAVVAVPAVSPAASLAASDPAGAAPGPVRYVALGDSYSAASGVLPADPTSPLCVRSTRNYPHVIAARLGARLTDVTCGAAQTKDFATAQYPGIAPQVSALRRRTQLVTMTIGGNDDNTFIGAIAECGVAGLSTLGRGSPCRDRYGDSFAADIRQQTYPALKRSLRAVMGRAPHARVAILGYPWILPRTGGCFDKMPVATRRRAVPPRCRGHPQPRRTTRRRRHRRDVRQPGEGLGGPRRLPGRRACAGSSPCSRARTRSWSTPTPSARGTWPGARCGCSTWAERVAPDRTTAAGSAALAGLAVDQLTGDVEVAGVPGVLLDQVEQDPLELWRRGRVGEAPADGSGLGQVVRLDDRARTRARRLEQTCAARRGSPRA